MRKKVISPLKNFAVVNFETDALGRKYVDIFYKRRKVGNVLTMNIRRMLKRSVSKRIKVPKGMKVIRIENNKPRVRAVTITYESIRPMKKKLTGWGRAGKPFTRAEFKISILRGEAFKGESYGDYLKDYRRQMKIPRFRRSLVANKRKKATSKNIFWVRKSRGKKKK